LAVAINDPEYNGVNTASELPIHRLAMLRRFFQDYKLLEGKTVEVDEMQQAQASESVINDSLTRYSTQRRKGFGGRKKG
jgi:inorganic pyrophosphatase